MKRVLVMPFARSRIAIMVFVLSLMLVLFTMVMVRAVESVTLSGRVYNGATGVGYAGVTLDLCGVGSVVTGANGNWEVSAAGGAPYCVRVVAGAPVGVSGPVTRNNPEVNGRATYEYQRAGENCYHNLACDANLQQWDRRIDGGLDFAYGLAAPVAAAATPPPAPASPAVAAEILAMPVEFKAELTGATAPEVKLSWKLPEGAVASGGYRLERSLDRETWSLMADKLPDLGYLDREVNADVHYYYRLVAALSDGRLSDPALTDIAVGKVLAESNGGDRTYTSRDQVATVVVPEGTIPPDTECQVVPGSTIEAGSRRVLVGPYELSCRTAAGEVVTEFGRTVQWRLEVGERLRGAVPPQLVRAERTNQPSRVTSHYDKKLRRVTATLPASGRVAVVENPIDYTWVNYVVIGVMAAIVVVLVLVLPLRQRRRQNYQEYLRAKYYNL